MAVKYSRAHKFYYFETDAVFAGNAVKLFFYRFGRKGEWKALLSPDTSLTPYKAYQIYSMRWSIEVSFYDKHIIMQSNTLSSLVKPLIACFFVVNFS